MECALFLFFEDPVWVCKKYFWVSKNSNRRVQVAILFLEQFLYYIEVGSGILSGSDIVCTELLNTVRSTYFGYSRLPNFNLDLLTDYN